MIAFREERIEEAITTALEHLRLTPDERARLTLMIRDMKGNWLTAKEVHPRLQGGPVWRVLR